MTPLQIRLHPQSLVFHLIAVCSELRTVCCTYAPGASTCTSIIDISVKTFPLVPLGIVGPRSILGMKRLHRVFFTMLVDLVLKLLNLRFSSLSSMWRRLYNWRTNSAQPTKDVPTKNWSLRNEPTTTQPASLFYIQKSNMPLGYSAPELQFAKRAIAAPVKSIRTRSSGHVRRGFELTSTRSRGGFDFETSRSLRGLNLRSCSFMVQVVSHFVIRLKGHDWLLL